MKMIRYEVGKPHFKSLTFENIRGIYNGVSSLVQGALYIVRGWSKERDIVKLQDVE